MATRPRPVRESDLPVETFALRESPRIIRETLLLLLHSPNCKKSVLDIYQQLGKGQCQRYSPEVRSAEDLEEFILKYPQVFIIQGFGKSGLVSPKTDLRLCPRHSNQGGSCPDGICQQLHICKFHLLSGKCTFANCCFFGHDLMTQHNQHLLAEHLLSGLSFTELRVLYCLPWVRGGVTLPTVCRYYNRIGGCNAKKTGCRSLHMCRPYLLEECTFGDRCRRNHSLYYAQVFQVLTLFGIEITISTGKDILAELRNYLQENDNGNDCSDDSDEERVLAYGVSRMMPKRSGSVPNRFQGKALKLMPEANGRRTRHTSHRGQPNDLKTEPDPACGRQLEDICLFHLRGNCKFGNFCMRLHSSYPFLWRFAPFDQTPDNAVWWNLDDANSLQLERNYCQPEVNDCVVYDVDRRALVVNFRKFMAKRTEDSYQFRVNRLTTPSSMKSGMSSGARQPLSIATTWLWFWRSADNKWHEFGLEDESVERLPVRSDAVERNYLTSWKTPFPVGRFILDFGKMRLKDPVTGHKFKVTRRPRFWLYNKDAESQSSSSEDALVSSVSNQLIRNDARTPICDAADCLRDFRRTDSATELRTDLSTELRIDSLTGELKNVLKTYSPAELNEDFLTKVCMESKEYGKVRSAFLSTLGKVADINSIHRVENRLLVARYNRQKLSMSTSPDKASERTLYFCSEGSLASICQDGIDCSSHGVQFYVNAARADKQNGSARNRRVFVVKCLVGCSGKIKSSMRAPSASELGAEQSGKQLDSFVDDVRHPTTFVIFDKRQVRPQYLVTYTLA